MRGNRDDTSRMLGISRRTLEPHDSALESAPPGSTVRPLCPAAGQSGAPIARCRRRPRASLRRAAPPSPMAHRLPFLLTTLQPPAPGGRDTPEEESHAPHTHFRLRSRRGLALHERTLAAQSSAASPVEAGHAQRACEGRQYQEDDQCLGDRASPRSTAAWTTDQIKEAQQGLAKAGLYKGTATGVMNKRHREGAASSTRRRTRCRSPASLSDSVSSSSSPPDHDHAVPPHPAPPQGGAPSPPRRRWWRRVEAHRHRAPRALSLRGGAGRRAARAARARARHRHRRSWPARRSRPACSRARSTGRFAAGRRRARSALIAEDPRAAPRPDQQPPPGRPVLARGAEFGWTAADDRDRLAQAMGAVAAVSRTLDELSRTRCAAGGRLRGALSEAASAAGNGAGSGTGVSAAGRSPGTSRTR